MSHVPYTHEPCHTHKYFTSSTSTSHVLNTWCGSLCEYFTRRSHTTKGHLRCSRSSGSESRDVSLSPLCGGSIFFFGYQGSHARQFSVFQNILGLCVYVHVRKMCRCHCEICLCPLYVVVLFFDLFFFGIQGVMGINFLRIFAESVPITRWIWLCSGRVVHSFICVMLR